MNESYQRNLVFKDQNKGGEGVDQKRVFDVSEERMKIIHEVDREILNGEKSFPPSVVSLRTEELGAHGNPLCNEPPIHRSSSLPSARSSSKATFLCLHCRPWPFLHGHQRVFPRAGWFNSSHLAGARSRNGRRNVIQGTRLNPHKLAVHRLPREVDWCRSPSLR